MNEAPSKSQETKSNLKLPVAKSDASEKDSDIGATLIKLMRSGTEDKPNRLGAHSGSPSGAKGARESEPEPTTVTVSVGKIQDGSAYLLTSDLNFIELPLTVLPKNIRKGNILSLTIQRNLAEEEQRKQNIVNIQREILNNPEFFGKPKTDK